MRSRVWRIRGATLNRQRGGVVCELTRGLNAALHDSMSNSDDSISHLMGGASNSDGMRSQGANM